MPDPVTAIIGGTIGAAGANIIGARSASEKQQQGARDANAQLNSRLNQGLDAQRTYFDEGTGQLRPIAEKGAGVYGDLVDQLPDLTAPITMDQATLEATPGYQFNVQQGMRAIDLSAISRGLSGAQAKAAAMFGVNTANTLYKDQWDMANQNKTNAFNRLLQTAQVGTDAAKSIAGNATSAGNAALAGATGTGAAESKNLTDAAKAAAGADIATAANVGSAISGSTNLYANRGNINRLLSTG